MKFWNALTASRVALSYAPVMSEALSQPCCASTICRSLIASGEDLALMVLSVLRPA